MATRFSLQVYVSLLVPKGIRKPTVQRNAGEAAKLGVWLMSMINNVWGFPVGGQESFSTNLIYVKGSNFRAENNFHHDQSNVKTCDSFVWYRALLLSERVRNS